MIFFKLGTLEIKLRIQIAGGRWDKRELKEILFLFTVFLKEYWHVIKMAPQNLQND